MNSVQLIGRLTRDGEYHVTDKGRQVFRFQIAVDRPFSKEKETDFPRIIVFGKQAENCSKYLSKGKMAGITGRIQTGSYQDKEGKTVYTTDVVAERVEFLSPKEDNPQQAFSELNESVPF